MEIFTHLIQGLELFWRPFMIFSLLQALICMGVKESKYFKSKPVEERLKQNGSLRKTISLMSVTLSLILIIELLSLNLIAVASFPANVMMGPFMFLGFSITWGLPLAVLFAIMLSIKYRISGRTLLSVIIQIVAFLVATVPIVWLFK